MGKTPRTHSKRPQHRCLEGKRPGAELASHLSAGDGVDSEAGVLHRKVDTRYVGTNMLCAITTTQVDADREPSVF